MRLEGNETADRRRRALADRNAHALGLFRHTGRVDLSRTHYDTVATLALLAHLDKTLDLRAGDRDRQNRMRDAFGLQGRGGEAQGNRRNSKRQWKPDTVAAHQDGDC